MPSKVHIVKAMVFPVIMYGHESCTIEKAECQIIDVFKLWCWRRLLRVPWTAKRSNQSILKEINPEYSLEGRMLFEYTSLYYAVEPSCLSIPSIMICIFSHRLPIYPSPSPLPPWQPQACSLCLLLCFGFMDTFIYIIL